MRNVKRFRNKGECVLIAVMFQLLGKLKIIDWVVKFTVFAPPDYFGLAEAI